jgi:hypothetical protein
MKEEPIPKSKEEKPNREIEHKGMEVGIWGKGFWGFWGFWKGGAGWGVPEGE